jgi:hypothetical protein
VIQAVAVGHAEDGDVQAEVVDRVRVVAEGERTHAGVQSVGPDDQVEGLGRRVAEGDVHAPGVLLQAGDRVAEEVLGAVHGRLVQDGAQVAAEDLHVAREDAGRHAGHRAPVLVHVGGGGQVGLPFPDPVQDAHLGQYGQVGGAAEVDRVAAAAQPRRAFHHGGAEPVPGEPPGQGGAGHARAGDQDALVLQGSVLHGCVGHGWYHTNV